MLASVIEEKDGRVPLNQSFINNSQNIQVHPIFHRFIQFQIDDAEEVSEERKLSSFLLA